MTPEDSQKICVECRALVPQDAVLCPECGYPFEDDQKVKCNACNSIVVADVDLCPVCGANVKEQDQVAEEEAENQGQGARIKGQEELDEQGPGVGVQGPEEKEEQVSEVQEAETPIPVVDSVVEEEQPEPPPVLPALSTAVEPEPVVDEPPAQQALAVAVEPSSMESTDRLQVMEGMLVQLTATVQAVAARGDDMGQVVEAVAAVQAQLEELQATNQQLLQQNQSAAADAEQAEGPTLASLTEQVAELRTAVAELADKGAAGTTALQGTVNSLSTKVTESTASRTLPESLQWLDYMFVAIIVSLIFSMGNLLIMAYIARLIMSIEFE